MGSGAGWKWRAKCIALACMFWSLAIAEVARAEERSFIGLPNGGSESWNGPSNWTGGNTPELTDVVLIKDDDGLDRHVMIESSAAAGSLSIGNSGSGLTTLYQAADLTTTYEYLGGSNLGSSTKGSRASHVQNGGTNTTGSLQLGAYSSSNPSSSGTYTLNAGELNVLSLAVGVWGSGRFEQNGGAVKAEGMGIAGARGTTGMYALNGGALEVPYETVGFSGKGTFIQSGGTHVVTDTLWVSYTPDPNGGGTYLLSGASANLVVASEYIGRGGVKGMFIQSGGAHLVQSYCVVGYSNGDYDLSGGSFSVLGELDINSGSFNQSGGTVAVGTKLSNGILIVGQTRGFYNLTGGSADLTVWGTESVGDDAGWGRFFQSSGTHTVSGALDVGGKTLDVQSSEYHLGGGRLSVGKQVFVGVHGPGQLTQSGGDFSTPLLTIGSGGSVDWSDGSLEVDNLSIGGHMTLAAGSGRTLEVSALKIDPFTTHALDLADNSAVIDYSGPSPLATIQQYLIDSRMFTSSAIPGVTGLGYLDDGSSVLVKYAQMGDTDLNGTVDLLDFENFLNGFAPSEAAPLWVDGDFDYSGAVKLNDFELYLNGYYALGGSKEGISDAVKSSGLPESDQAAMLVLVATVPEPAGVLIGWVGLLAMRRRRF